MGKRPKVAVLGLGALGCHMAFHLAPFCDVVIIDRNAPFDTAPTEQTSSAAIGIIEPPNIKPWRKTNHWYLTTREWFKRLIREDCEFVQEIQIQYYTNEDGHSDGPTGRAPDEDWQPLDPKSQGLDFQFGEQFRGVLVNTTQYNFWIRRKLIEMGVKFDQREITEDPGEVRVSGQPQDLVFDCRGLGLSATEAGKYLEPTSGQTVLLHAPEGTEFAGIIGNTGSEISYNIVPWMKVTEANVRMLGLSDRFDHTQGGTFVLVGATKHRGDHNWAPQKWIVNSLIEGAAKLDPRVREWKPVLIRKGLRAKLAEGILDQRRQYGDTVVRSMAGWAGVAYCASYGYAEEVVQQELTAFGNREEEVDCPKAEKPTASKKKAVRKAVSTDPAAIV